ncbi:hypothetical protein Bca52824_072964 [Brassica carinata]|uniref:Uncharacterized protein n=1 Tax=Brassica carinata TaxID=52824 RepID=A0A8X7QC50_BRACI|nr:hypothetical protein Bca52824_072964 [Brassica carinata]
MGRWCLEDDRKDRRRATQSGKAVACKKKKKANAQPVDLLPFYSEEKRPIRPRNPPMSVTPEKWLECAYESVESHIRKTNGIGGLCSELVKGLIHPKKVWLEDVDVIYGVIEDKLSYHYIGVEIQLIDNTITLFHQGLPKANIKRALNQIQEPLLISAIKMELLGEEMLKCRSLGLKSMTNINDETAMDLRSKLCCEIFDQFMDKDFQEGQTKMS